MPNFNKSVPTVCPQCKQKRMARGDVVRKAERNGVQLFCKPCRNKERFSLKPHPKKGTGIKNDQGLKRTCSSFSKAKWRCKAGEKHHRSYAGVEFKFETLQQLIDEIGIRPEGCTLDRIDGAGNYEPGNVRWATIKQQTENRFPRQFWETHKRENGRIVGISSI